MEIHTLLSTMKSDTILTGLSVCWGKQNQAGAGFCCGCGVEDGRGDRRLRQPRVLQPPESGETAAGGEGQPSPFHGLDLQGL